MSKSIRVNEEPYGLDGESNVVFTPDGKRGTRVSIHPWQTGVNGRSDSRVAVIAGILNKDGDPALNESDEDDEYEIALIDREDFVEGILAVFPELTRAEVSQ